MDSTDFIRIFPVYILVYINHVKQDKLFNTLIIPLQYNTALQK